MSDSHFDQHQFASRRQYPVSAWHEAGQMKSTQLDFVDYSRCHTQQRLRSGVRRLPTPSWPFSDQAVRHVLVTFLAKRVSPLTYKDRAFTGTAAELAEVQAVYARYAKTRIPVLDGLCKRFVALKDRKHGANRQRVEHDGGKLDHKWLSWDDPVLVRELKSLPIQIQNLDTVIRTAPKIAALLTCALVYFYRVRYDSVGVCEELKHQVRPPTVRQWVKRLNTTARALGYE